METQTLVVEIGRDGQLIDNHTYERVILAKILAHSSYCLSLKQ